MLDLLAMTKQTVQEIKTMANREADNVISVAQAEAERIISERGSGPSRSWQIRRSACTRPSAWNVSCGNGSA